MTATVSEWPSVVCKAQEGDRNTQDRDRQGVSAAAPFLGSPKGMQGRDNDYGEEDRLLGMIHIWMRKTDIVRFNFRGSFSVAKNSKQWSILPPAELELLRSLQEAAKLLLCVCPQKAGRSLGAML